MLRNVFEFKLIFGMGGGKRILICWNVLVCNVGCVGKGRRFLKYPYPQLGSYCTRISLEELLYNYMRPSECQLRLGENTIFTTANKDRSMFFFYADSPHLWASILKIFCPSVCRSGHKRHKCKNTESWISRLLVKQLFYSECLSVR